MNKLKHFLLSVFFFLFFVGASAFFSYLASRFFEVRDMYTYAELPSVYIAAYGMTILALVMLFMAPYAAVVCPKNTTLVD